MARTTVDNKKSKKTKNAEVFCNTHRMHLDVSSVVACCADCNTPLPVPVLAFVAMDYVEVMARMGIIVSWPACVREGVARA